MDPRTQRQIAANEARFREMNERHVDELARFRDGEQAAGQPVPELTIMCECALDECSDSIDLPADQYSAVRLEPTHFLVRPGHIVDGAERQVEDRGSYWIVAKVAEGAEVARERA